MAKLSLLPSTNNDRIVSEFKITYYDIDTQVKYLLELYDNLSNLSDFKITPSIKNKNCSKCYYCSKKRLFKPIFCTHLLHKDEVVSGNTYCKLFIEKLNIS